jgi:hypothetical protein
MDLASPAANAPPSADDTRTLGDALSDDEGAPDEDGEGPAPRLAGG